MKTISANVKAELSSSEILEALVRNSDAKQLLSMILEDSPDALQKLLKNNREEVFKAITGYLSDNHNLTTDKVIYQNGKIIVEARNGAGLPVVKQVAERTRVAPEGHTKVNKGVFQSLREYLDDERKNKRKEIPFDEVLKDMQFFFPKLTARRLQIYLHDKRQLKGVDYKAKRGTVILK
jgi:hypothetical protein